MTTKKLQIIQIENETLDCKILKTVETYAEASEFMNKWLDKEFEISDYLKVFHNNSNSLSIYKYFTVFPKRLLCKIHIVEYLDTE